MEHLYTEAFLLDPSKQQDHLEDFVKDLAAKGYKYYYQQSAGLQDLLGIEQGFP